MIFQMKNLEGCLLAAGCFIPVIKCHHLCFPSRAGSAQGDLIAAEVVLVVVVQLLSSI